MISSLSAVHVTGTVKRIQSLHTHTRHSQDYSRFCLHIGHKIEIDPSGWMDLCQGGCWGENIFHLISGILCEILNVVPRLKGRTGESFNLSAWRHSLAVCSARCEMFPSEPVPCSGIQSVAHQRRSSGGMQSEPGATQDGAGVQRSGAFRMFTVSRQTAFGHSSLKTTWFTGRMTGTLSISRQLFVSDQLL